jgi:hypothetical protein
MFWFTKTIPSPLTKFCTRLDDNLGVGCRKMAATASGADNERTSRLLNAGPLSVLIMAASGHFGSKTLHSKILQGSRRYLRETNLDVITAEASVWITFLMRQFWEHEKDREMLERVAYETFSTAEDMTLRMIKSETGIDFTARAIERRKLYHQALKDDALFEAFASVVFRSIGCKSLAEPLKPNGPKYMLAPEWTPICLYVAIFFKTMPQGYYDTFKNIVLEAARSSSARLGSSLVAILPEKIALATAAPAGPRPIWVPIVILIFLVSLFLAVQDNPFVQLPIANVIAFVGIAGLLRLGRS